MVSKMKASSPKSHADITRLLKGADPDLVTAMLPNLPPSFFVVGAPRCGTTALSRALSGNQRVSFSKPKETHFFLEDRSTMPIDDVRRLYLERFHPNLTRDCQAIGDGSVTYLYDPQAIRQAMNFDSRAKFIVAVRNPLDMLSSYHARMLFMLDEDEEDFARAWQLQDSRRAGRELPKQCRDPQLLQYADVGSLGKHVEQLFAVAGRERCQVVVFDDFAADPGGVYVQLLGFLGVDDDGRREFKSKRSNAGYRSRWMQQFAMNPPPWIFKLIESSNAGTLKRLKRLRKRIKRFNKAPQVRAELAEPVRAMLRDYYRSDVEKLSGLLGRDLTHWLAP
jgi:hypothetical protein